MSSKLFFSNRYSYSFCPIVTKLGIHVLCTEETVEQIFEIMILKFMANF